MKRADNKKKKSLKWINKGSSSFDLWVEGKRKIIKPNEKFTAEESQVPVAFRDVIECLTKVVDGPAIDSQDGKDVITLSLKEAGEGLYNVVDNQGKVQNEEPMSKEAAEAFIKEKEEEEE